MIASIALTAALWPAAVIQACNPGEDVLIAGIAHNTHGQLIYCEMISKSADHQLQINYIHGKKVFATKRLSYGQNPKMPDVLQQDSRSGEVRGAKLANNQILLQYQPNRHKKMAQATIAANKADVVDAGFDNYMRQHWTKLISGKIVPVNFASMSHLKVLPLRIRHQPLASCGSSIKEGFCFVVEIDNALLRLLLGNIKLLYDNQHRLQKFEGIVNLNNDREDNQKATIHYYYRSDYQPQSSP